MFAFFWPLYTKQIFLVCTDFSGLSTVGVSTEMCDVNYIYFFGILKHLLNINQLVRSIREASFDLFVASLKQLWPLLFALDHIHYSRWPWMPVFILFLKLLNVSDPEHYHSFSKGYFVARKTYTAFSKIAFDQLYMNKTTKSLNQEPVSQVC